MQAYINTDDKILCVDLKIYIVQQFQIVDRAVIQDKPVFKYRGVILDTSRNFISVKTLKRLIDGMSYNKLNMFHWHITDTHSFPFYSKSVPQVNYLLFCGILILKILDLV